VVERPRLTLSERMSSIFNQLEIDVPAPFYKVIDASGESLDVAISFQAVLELAKNQQIDLQQVDWNDLLWLNRIS
jgi:chromatin segregation and condensation protein Rec8/ScpA/Scc1 (kleisin family)